jgi:hypothetical protein
MVYSTDEGDFVFPFEKIEVWQLSVDLADFVFGLLESFPPNKHFRVIGQMESAVSGIVFLKILLKEKADSTIKNLFNFCISP